MSIVDTELVSYKQKLTEVQVGEVFQECKRLDKEYLESALLFARPGQQSITESIKVSAPAELPRGVSATLAIGMNASSLPTSRHFYVFAFPDGSWFKQDLINNTFVFVGSELIWSIFFARLITSIEA